MVCPNCRNQVADEEIQCPNCFIVLKQLICGNCKNILDLRYLQCVFCGQPYALPYQRQVQEPSQQDPPEVKGQQYSNQPVTQFSMQASKSPRLSNKAYNQTEKRKDSIFDGDKPKGLKLILWAMRPANGKTLTMRENLKLFLMMLGCALTALIIIIAGFNIKDLIDNNTAANERKQRLTATENTSTLIVPTEQVIDDSNERRTNTSTLSSSKTVMVQDNSNTDLGATFSISFLELIELHNKKNEDFEKTNSVDLSAYYIPKEGWLPLHTTTDKGNLSTHLNKITSLESISIGYEPETGNVTDIMVESFIDDEKSATQMELMRCSMFLAVLMNTDLNQAYNWHKKGMNQQVSNFKTTGNLGVPFYKNICINATDIGWMIAATSTQIKSTMSAFDVPLY